MKKLLIYLSGLFLFASLVGNVFAIGSTGGSVGSIGSDAQLWRTTAAGTYLIPTMTGAGVVRDIGATGDRIPKGWFADLDSTIATIGGLTTGAIIIDVTDVEALLVRRDADAGDVFAVDTTNSRVFIPDTIPLAFGNTSAAPDATIAWNTAQTVDGWYFGTATGQNTLILAENGDIAFDFAHGAQTNPTLFIHSNNQSTTQWLSLAHNATDGLIAVGTGGLQLPTFVGIGLAPGTNTRFRVGANADDIAGYFSSIGATSTATANSNNYLESLRYIAAPAAASDASFVGQLVIVTTTAGLAQNLTNQMIGVQNFANPALNAGNTLDLGSATLATFENDGGTTTDARVFWSQLVKDAGTITTGYHFYVQDSTGAGALGTQYGLFVENLTGGTTNRAIQITGTGVANAIRLGASSNIYSNAADNIRFMDSTDGGGLGFTMTAAGDQQIFTTDTGNNAIVFQNQTFTSGVAHSATIISPTWTTENFSHIGENISVTQNGANTIGLIGLNITVTKDAAASTLALANGIQVGIVAGVGSTITTGNSIIVATPTGGTIVNSFGIQINNQSLAGGTNAAAIAIGSQTANATTTRAIDLAGTGVNNAIRLGASPNIYSNGAENIRFMDSTNVRGIDFTLTAAGNQTIGTTAGDLVLSPAVAVQLNNDINLAFGTTNVAATAALIQYDTAETSDGLKIGLNETSRHLIIGDYSDINTDTTIAADTNPMVYIRNAAATAQIGIGTDGTNPIISSSTSIITIPTSIYTGSQGFNFRTGSGSDEQITFENSIGADIYILQYEQLPYLDFDPSATGTNQTASTERSGIDWNTSTATWATGDIATERWFRWQAPTIEFAGSSTITNMTNFVMTAPTAGNYAAFVNTDIMQLGGNVDIGTTSAAMTYDAIDVRPHTVTVEGTTQVTGTPSFTATRLGIITITNPSAVTVDQATTLYLAGAPAQAGSVTLTTPYTIFSDAGDNRFDGDVLIGTSTSPNELEIWGAGTTTLRASSTTATQGGCLLLKDTTNSTEYGVVITGGVLGTTTAANC